MRNCSWNLATDTAALLRHAPARGLVAATLSGLIGGMLLLLGCTPSPSSPPPSKDRIGVVASYVFEPDSQTYIAAPQPFPLDPDMSPAAALTALGRHLSRTYFSSSDVGNSAIRFEVLGVHRLPVAHRPYRLAVVNMIDPRQEALQGYFQGSAGGLTTYYLLTATFLQPQLDPPLADGLILLYNGEEFPEIDHVNFRGIATPETIRPLVTKVLYRYRPDSRDATG
jgi:hypothetical protein